MKQNQHVQCPSYVRSNYCVSNQSLEGAGVLFVKGANVRN